MIIRNGPGQMGTCVVVNMVTIDDVEEVICFCDNVVGVVGMNVGSNIVIQFTYTNE
jgi:hypothetical protein